MAPSHNRFIEFGDPKIYKAWYHELVRDLAPDGLGNLNPNVHGFVYSVVSGLWAIRNPPGFCLVVMALNEITGEIDKVLRGPLAFSCRLLASA